MEFTEKTINSEEIYQGKIIKVRIDEVELANGNKSKREIVEHPAAVTIIAVKEDGRILLVEQYRKPIESTLLELPAGKIDEGEEPDEAARRELQEETGYQAGKMQYLFSFYSSPGFTNEILHLYLATSLKQHDINPDEDENLLISTIAKTEILQAIKNGELKDSKTVTGLLFYLGGDI